MKTEDRILINIIGTGYDLRLGQLNDDNYKILNKIDKQKNDSINELLFNKEFYTKSQISYTYKSWTDFNDIGIYRGVNLSEMGQIEIWINRKRKKRLLVSEIIEPTSLFPLFKTKKENLLLKSHQIIIGVEEKGHLNKFVINTPKFLIEELEFHFVEIKLNSTVLKVLKSISYQGLFLKSVKNDTVITGTICEIAKD